MGITTPSAHLYLWHYGARRVDLRSRHARRARYPAPAPATITTHGRRDARRRRPANTARKHDPRTVLSSASGVSLIIRCLRGRDGGRGVALSVLAVRESQLGDRDEPPTSNAQRPDRTPADHPSDRRARQPAESREFARAHVETLDAALRHANQCGRLGDPQCDSVQRHAASMRPQRAWRPGLTRRNGEVFLTASSRHILDAA